MTHEVKPDAPVPAESRPTAQQPTPAPWYILEVGDRKFIAAKPTEDHPYFGKTRNIDIAGDEDYPRKQADLELICTLRNAASSALLPVPENHQAIASFANKVGAALSRHFGESHRGDRPDIDELFDLCENLSWIVCQKTELGVEDSHEQLPCHICGTALDPNWLNCPKCEGQSHTRVCNLCKHSLTNNSHGFDQGDAWMEGDKLVHSGTCTYCKECNPKLKESYLKEKQ